MGTKYNSITYSVIISNGNALAGFLNQQVRGCKLLLKQAGLITLVTPLLFFLWNPRGSLGSNQSFALAHSVLAVVWLVSHHRLVYCSPQGRES